MNNISCFLCFQSIQDINPRSQSKFDNKDYKQKLFECCHRLLGIKIENNLKLNYSTISFSPFCSTCFESSEKLWQIEENAKNNTTIKEKLKCYIEKFTSEILRFRLTVLSKKIDSESDTEDEIVGYRPKQSNQSQSENFMSSVPPSTYPIKYEVKNESLNTIDIVEEYFVIDDPIVSGDYSRNINVPFQFLDPLAEPQQKTLNNLRLTNNWQNAIPQLRVVLERLQFDSNGKVIIPICENNSFVKRKVAIAALTSLSLNSRKHKDDLWEDDELHTSRISDDELEFIGGDLNLESDESEGNKKTVKPSRTDRKRKQESTKDKHFPKVRKPCRSRTSHFKKQRSTSTRSSVLKRKTEYHSNLLKQGRDLKCVVCSSRHKWNLDLDLHSNESGHTNERQFKCSQCSKTYYRREDLENHQYLCLYTNRRCKICKKVLICRNISSYRQHIESHKMKGRRRRHYNKKEKLEFATKYKCAVCSSMFTRAKAFYTHSKKEGHSTVPSLQCDKCTKKFYILRDLNSHIRNYHEFFERCPICKKIFSNRASFRVHEKTHRKIPENRDAHETTHPTKIKIFDCSHCGTSVSGIIHFKEHFQSHIGEKIYKCDDCSAEFYTEAMLLRHKNGHEKNLQFQCTICLLFFNTKGGLSRHSVESHPEDEKNRIKCDACEQTFIELRHFIAHKITDHEMRSPFNCSHCIKTFNYRVHLKDHLKHEHGQKINDKEPESCVFCEKTFKEPRNLIIHTLTHTNMSREVIRKICRSKYDERGSHLCSECGKVFRYSKGLTDHWQKIHAPDAQSKRRVCPICGKILVNDRYFRKHQAVHNKKFVCEMCGRAFSERNGLLGHITRIHEQNKTPRKSYTRTANPKLRPSETYYAPPPDPPVPN